MAFSPPEYCRLFAQKKAYQGGVTGTPGPPLATPLILYLIYIEKTVYIKTHKTAINRAVDWHWMEKQTSCLEGLETSSKAVE